MVHMHATGPIWCYLEEFLNRPKSTSATPIASASTARSHRKCLAGFCFWAYLVFSTSWLSGAIWCYLVTRSNQMSALSTLRRDTSASTTAPHPALRRPKKGLLQFLEPPTPCDCQLQFPQHGQPCNPSSCSCSQLLLLAIEAIAVHGNLGALQLSQLQLVAANGPNNQQGHTPPAYSLKRLMQLVVSAIRRPKNTKGGTANAKAPGLCLGAPQFP